MKTLLTVLVSLLVTTGYNENSQRWNNDQTFEHLAKTNTAFKKERITIYNCRNINGEVRIDAKPLEIFVIEYDEYDCIKKSSQYINNEVTGLIRYRYDENHNLYMTNHYKGKLISKIYKAGDGKWMEYSNGKTVVRDDCPGLVRPKRPSLQAFIKGILTIKGAKDIETEVVYRDLTKANKHNVECYFTYSLPDDSGEETLYVTKEILEYYTH